MSYLKSIVVFLLFQTSSPLNYNPTINYIIHGNFTKSGTFPYQAAISGFSLVTSWFCGGSLITTNFVLTAAHCLLDAQKIGVALGTKSSHNLKEAPVYMESIYFLAHKNFREFGYHDIGLVKLPIPVTLGNGIATVQLPAKRDATNNYDGYTAIVSGWGKNENGVKSEKLKFLKVVIVPKSKCIMPIDDSEMICAFGKNHGRVCRGDSGGPLVIENPDGTATQIGIVSFVNKGCTEGFPAVYSRVTRYLDWIQQHSNYKLN